MTTKQLTKKIESIKGKLTASRDKRQQMKAQEDQWSTEVKELTTRLKEAKIAGKPKAATAAATKTADAEE